MLSSIVSSSREGGGEGIELLNFSHIFNLFTKQRKRIDLFCNEQIYFSAYFIKTVFQISDFKVLRDNLISTDEKQIVES